MKFWLLPLEESLWHINTAAHSLTVQPAADAEVYDREAFYPFSEILKFETLFQLLMWSPLALKELSRLGAYIHFAEIKVMSHML